MPPLPVNDASTLTKFIHGLVFADLPPEVVKQSVRCMVDLCGVAAGGSSTALSNIARNHAAEHFGTNSVGARMLFDGRRVSMPGAALAGGMTIDSLDAHDGHVLTKGHVGVTVLPALLALADLGHVREGQEFLCALVLGYEVATRAGIALHETACDYHTSGAWNALGAAALGARSLALNPAETLEALGIAEYHGPRSQMMRCIDHPTMVKDGSGWGAMAGMSAALLAKSGFTGAPALTAQEERVAHLWADLGTRWYILEQYFKPYPVCRWAQPAVEAALSLQREHGVPVGRIARVEVTTFHQAARLATRSPRNTEAAQYSLPFSVAISLARGRLGADEVNVSSLDDAEALRLSSSMLLKEDVRFNNHFPAQRWARVSFELLDGTLLHSAPHTARGDPESMLSAAEIEDKYLTLATPIVGSAKASLILKEVELLVHPNSDMSALLDLVLNER
jgi:2-methylcitrate dehydratase PrpD